MKALNLAGDSAKHCHLLPGIRRLDRWIRADRVPAMPPDHADTLGELVDDNDRLLG